jgi:hypothetical protein
MIKYAIFNPLNGQYEYVDTVEQCQQTMANTAYGFYMLHSHNNPASIVEYFEDGSEKWLNYDNTTFEITKEMKDMFANSTSMIFNS